MLAQLAARGLGVAILPASVANGHEDLHPLTITRPELRGRLAFAWRAEGPISPAARALIGRARRMVNT
ncbi:MAG TPA: LysR substrate-binding domain-containing protein [Pseudonocardiaceae bacterium]